MIPASFALKHTIVSLGYDNEGKLVIAAAESSPLLNDSLAFVIEEPYVLVQKPLEEIIKLQEELYEEHQVAEPRQPFQTQQPEHLEIFHDFIRQGISQNASDIHIEAFSDYFRVRFRVNGKLYLYNHFGKKYNSLITNHIKIISHLSIDLKSAPQNGKFIYTLGGNNYALRVSVIPSVHGESLVLRVHKDERFLLTLDRVGLTESQLEVLINITKQGNGLILVCGATGSGKTTTLYALIKYLREQELKTITIEDPVEATIEGVNQVKVGQYVDYEGALKSILRQSPDVIMIGEIREADVAKVAFQASLTGHLVLASMHAGSAEEAILRFEEMGIPKSDLESGLRLILAQRLVENSEEQRQGIFEISLL